jgi:hypothetical protein
MPTAIQPRLVEAPGKGLMRHVDPRHVPENAFTNGRNIRFPTGGSRVRTTDGYRRVDDSVPPEPVQALWWYVDPTTDPTAARPPVLVRIGLTIAVGELGSNRTRFATLTPPRTLDNVVTVDQFKERLIWADGIQVMTWTGQGEATEMGGGAPTAKIVEIHKDHVLLANLTKPVIAPWNVTYSVVGFTDPETGLPDFTGEGASDIDFLEDATPITACKVLGDHAIVHKPNKLYRMIFVGPPDNYIVESIPSDEGSISSRGPISIGSYQYYPGRTNFYRLGSFSEPIGDAIWPEVADAIDWPRVHLTYAYRRLEHDEICWKIPTRGVTQPSLTAAYNFRDQTWTLTDHDPGTCFTEVPSDALGSTSHDDDLSPTSPPPVRGIFGQENGRIQVYGGRNADGVAIHAWVESRHFTEQLIPTKVVAVPVFATGTGTLVVQLRAAMEARQPMPPWPATPPASAIYSLSTSQTRPWVDVRVYGRLWQVRLESTAVDDDWEVSAYGTAVIPGAYAR